MHESENGIQARMSKEERLKLLRKQEESGLSRVEFCRREGIAAGTFYGWCKKLRKEKVGFIELRKPELKLSRGSTLELKLPNGAELKFSW